MNFYFKRQLFITLSIITLLFVTLFTLNYPTTQVIALENGLARTPPMGWNSWNLFQGNINETLIKGIADAMVNSGMRDAGYIYLNLDDNWMANPARDSNGNLIPDPSRFPSGMSSLASYVHSKGLKLGIYGDHGTMTCMKVPQSGSYGNEQRDANTYASWGIDYLKYDNCNLPSGDNSQTDYTNMSNALKNSGRSIVFSICAWQFQSWMPNVGNLWRTTGDISANWNSILSNMDTNAGLSAYAGPGHWNDPDMLEVGNGSLSTDENKSHFTMWCMMAAPLICGNDIRSMSSSIQSILTNTEVIAVDQDSAGIQGTKVAVNGSSEIWCKPLGSSNGTTKAVALFNRGSATTNITVNWSTIGISGNATVRDLWAHADRGTYNGSYTATIPTHGVVMLKITSNGNNPTPTPLPGNQYEAEAGSLSGSAVLTSSVNCSGGYKVGYLGNNSGTDTITVNVSSAGSYTMTVYYCSGDARSFYISVNGGTGVQLNCNTTGGFDTVGSTTIHINLNSGSNTIKFYNSSGYCPDLDKISLSFNSSQTPTVTPTTTPTVTRTATPTLTPTGGGYPAWAPNTAYSVGTIVSYGGKNYKCLQAHTSIVSWEPPNVPALWQAI